VNKTAVSILDELCGFLLSEVLKNTHLIGFRHRADQSRRSFETVITHHYTGYRVFLLLLASIVCPRGTDGVSVRTRDTALGKTAGDQWLPMAVVSDEYESSERDNTFTKTIKILKK
jgi:hypothetical protein